MQGVRSGTECDLGDVLKRARLAVARRVRERECSCVPSEYLIALGGMRRVCEIVCGHWAWGAVTRESLGGLMAWASSLVAKICFPTVRLVVGDFAPVVSRGTSRY